MGLFSARLLKESNDLLLFPIHPFVQHKSEAVPYHSILGRYERSSDFLVSVRLFRDLRAAARIRFLPNVDIPQLSKVEVPFAFVVLGAGDTKDGETVIIQHSVVSFALDQDDVILRFDVLKIPKAV